MTMGHGYAQLADAPAAWLQVGLSSDFRRGRGVRRVTRWGEELVAYRSASGRLVVHNSVCPHLGAHLGGGTVRGECLECPFHGWQYHPDGAVQYVPGARRVPSRARLDSYPTFEVGGIAFMYPKPAGPGVGVPPFASKVVEELEAAGSRVSLTRKHLRANLDEMGENAADFAHLFIVHAPIIVGSGPFEVGVGDDNSFAADGFVRVRLGGDVGMTIRLFDPCTSMVTVTTPYFVTNLLAFGGQVGPKRTELVLVTRTPKLLPGFGHLAHLVTRRNFLANFDQDQPIWAEKRWIDRPILSDADGPIASYRRWLSSFDPHPDAPPTGAWSASRREECR